MLDEDQQKALLAQAVTVMSHLPIAFRHAMQVKQSSVRFSV